MRERGKVVHVREPRSSARPWVRGLVCWLGVAANGCSLMSTHGPPVHYGQQQDLHCTRRYTAPIVDTVNTVIGVYAALLVYDFVRYPPDLDVAIAPPNARDTGFRSGLAMGPPLYAASNPVTTALLFGIPLVGLPAASAVYGYVNVADCRSASAELAAHQTASNAEPSAEP